MKWTFEIAGLDGDCRLFGVNIFRYSWRDCGETAAVIDPHHGVEKRFHVYEVIIEGVGVGRSRPYFVGSI